MNFDEWYEQEIGSGNKPEYEAAKWAWNHQQAKIDQLNKKNSKEKRILHNVIEMNQSKIDELQGRIDEALTYLRHNDFRECKESILFNILKGNKDD